MKLLDFHMGTSAVQRCTRLQRHLLVVHLPRDIRLFRNTQFLSALTGRAICKKQVGATLPRGQGILEDRADTRCGRATLKTSPSKYRKHGIGEDPPVQEHDRPTYDRISLLWPLIIRGTTPNHRKYAWWTPRPTRG